MLSVSGTEIIAKIQPLPADRRSCGIVQADVEVTNLNSNIRPTGVTFYYESPSPLITSVEITAASKTGNDNTVPQYNPRPSARGLCLDRAALERLQGHGARQQLPEDRRGLGDGRHHPGRDGRACRPPSCRPTRSTFMLPDLTGVADAGDLVHHWHGTCGLQYVQTRRLSLTVKNLRSNCDDTLGGAIVIEPCDTTCRPVTLTSLSFATQPPATATVGVPFVVSLAFVATAAHRAGHREPHLLRGSAASPSAVTIPANFAGQLVGDRHAERGGHGHRSVAQAGSSTCQITAVSSQVTVAMAIIDRDPTPGRDGRQAAYSSALSPRSGGTPPVHLELENIGTVPAGY